MERNMRPKLKDVKVTLMKLDMSCQVPVLEHGNERKKGNADSSEDTEDPSSENVSTGSLESNVVGTDDDDLEKKIQAFSIPVKKDNGKSMFKSETARVKIVGDQNVTRKGENSKQERKVTFSLSQSDIKPNKKDASIVEEPIESTIVNYKTTSEPDSIIRATRRKKENLNKNKTKSDNEKKTFSSGTRLSVLRQLKTQTGNTNLNSNDKFPSKKLRSEKNDEWNEQNVERKMRRGKHGNTMEQAGPKTSRKRKQENSKKQENKKSRKEMRENSQTPKKPLTGNGDPQMSCEPTTSKLQKTGGRTMEVKLKPQKKKTIFTKDLPKSSDGKYLMITRRTRFSSSANTVKHSRNESKEQRDSGNRNRQKRVAFKENLNDSQKSKIETKKTNSFSEVQNSSSSVLKINGNSTSKQTKKRANEKKESVVKRQISNLDMEIPKDGYTKRVQKTVTVQIDPIPASVTSQLNKSKAQIKELEFNQTASKDCSDILDDGEELFEKIYNILEDSNRKPDFSFGGKKNMIQKVHASHNRQTIIPRNRELCFKPNVLHEKPKFPSHCIGTKWYKKLWKWSDVVKMPSDMWSIHKHPHGNFVIVSHISEMSPFPKLLIDKCVLFKGTASPSVKIYGKDVLALSSDIELQTLGNVCLFLQQIHALSLCEGQLSPLCESSECELYTDGKVTMPYKCKYCL